MARVLPVPSFKMSYVIEFDCVVRGHHVYQSVWKSIVGKELNVVPDSREEDQLYDSYALGTYRFGELVGHVPYELSNLLFRFLEADSRNTIKVKVSGKRKCEVGLVIPARYITVTDNRKQAQILLEELQKVKTAELSVKQDAIYTSPIYY